MRTVLTSERLVLRKFMEDDHAFIIQLLNSKGWIEYIGNRNITDEQQAVTYIKEGLRSSYVKHGYGLYLVQTKSENVPVGICGFVKRNTLPVVDLGFAFLPQFTGNGFAHESAITVLDYGFTDLRFNKVAAITKPSNNRSINLLNKLGFQREEDIIINNEQLMLYGLAAK